MGRSKRDDAEEIADADRRSLRQGHQHRGVVRMVTTIGGHDRPIRASSITLSLFHGLSVQPAAELADAATQLDTATGLDARPSLAAAAAGMESLGVRRRCSVVVLDNTAAGSASSWQGGIGNPLRRSAAPRLPQRGPGGPDPADCQTCSRPLPDPPHMGQDPGHPAARRTAALGSHRRRSRGRWHRDRRPAAWVAAPLQRWQPGVCDCRSAPRTGGGRSWKCLGSCSLEPATAVGPDQPTGGGSQNADGRPNPGADDAGPADYSPPATKSPIGHCRSDEAPPIGHCRSDEAPPIGHSRPDEAPPIGHYRPDEAGAYPPTYQRCSEEIGNQPPTELFPASSHD
jgi:hypothetical protein